MFSNKEILNIFKQKPSQVVLDIQQSVVDKLKPEHKAKVAELRSRVQNVLKPTHNDFFLVKWLRARSYDVSAAEKMLREHLKWREEWRVDYIHEEIEPSEVLTKYAPIGLAGEDKNGNFVWILWAGNLDIQGAAHSIQRSDCVKYIILHLEYIERASYQQTEKHKKLITAQVGIVDLENLKIQDFIWKPVFEFFASQLKMLEANYPTLLRASTVINCPPVINVLYGMVKPFLSEATRKKISFFGKDGWKEALLETIDADQLPQHWGGTMVDEVDGNPYCSSKVAIGGTIPKSCYKSLEMLQMNREKMESALVANGSFINAAIEITEPGSVIRWVFLTEEHDIAFGVFRTPNEDERNNNTNNDQMRVVIPLSKTCSYLLPQDGKFVCQETGTYTLKFDNSYSWTRSKKLLYSIQVIKPDSTISNIRLSS